MNKEGSRRDQDVVIGGSVIGSAIGHHNIVANNTITSTHETGSASLEDLREAITLLRDEVETAGGSTPAGTEVQYELRKVEEELDEDEPDGAAVRTRWKQVLKLLGPLQHAANVAQITDRLFTLFAAH